jgi:hypothetical protein
VALWQVPQHWWPLADKLPAWLDSHLKGWVFFPPFFQKKQQSGVLGKVIGKATDGTDLA